MAVFFQLTRLGSSEASTFQSIDRAICHNLNLPFDDVRYVEGWYDVIGLRLAMGRTYQAITDEFKDRESDWSHTITRINHFLMENYTIDAWAGR